MIGFSVCLNAQKLNYQDLLKVYKSNMSDKETFLFTKGYKFERSYYQYACKQIQWSYKNAKPNEYYDISFSVCDDSSTAVTFYTNNEAIIVSLKTEIVQFGYKYIETKNYHGGIICHVYNNKEFKFLFMSGKDNLNETQYQIHLELLRK